MADEDRDALQVVDLSALKAANDYRTVDVPVPEWGGLWVVRSMTGAEQIALEFKSLRVSRDGSRTRDEGMYYAYTLAYGTHAPRLDGMEAAPGSCEHTNVAGETVTLDGRTRVANSAKAVTAAGALIQDRSAVPLTRIFDAIDTLNPSSDSHVDQVRLLLLSNRLTYMWLSTAVRSGLWKDLVGATDVQMEALCESLIPLAALYQVEAEFQALGMDPALAMLSPDQWAHVKAERAKAAQ